MKIEIHTEHPNAFGLVALSHQQRRRRTIPECF